LRLFAGLIEGRILLIAAGVTSYLILALFPGIAVLVSVYGPPSAQQKLESTVYPTAVGRVGRQLEYDAPIAFPAGACRAKAVEDGFPPLGAGRVRRQLEYRAGTFGAALGSPYRKGFRRVHDQAAMRRLPSGQSY
jgi:hypothetical protein